MEEFKKLTNKIFLSPCSSLKCCRWLQDFAWLQKGIVYFFKMHFFHFEALWSFLSVCPSLLFCSRFFPMHCRLSSLLVTQRTLVICWVQLWEGKERYHQTGLGSRPRQHMEQKWHYAGLIEYWEEERQESSWVVLPLDPNKKTSVFVSISVGHFSDA